MKKHERKYSATHRECLGVIFALRQFRQYFYGRRAAVVTDHMSLTHLMQLNDSYNQLVRWALDIASCQVDIVHAKGTSIPHVDALSRNPAFRKEEDAEAEWIAHQPIRRLELPITMTTDEQQVVADEPAINSSCDSLEEFRLEQLQDPALREKILHLEQQEPEEGSNNIYEGPYALINGLLYHQARNAVVNPWRLVIPHQLVGRVLQLMHDSETGGHYDIFKTYAKLRRRYWWTTMHGWRHQEVHQRPSLSGLQPKEQDSTRSNGELSS